MAPHSSILAWRIPWTEEPGITEQLTLSLSKAALQNTYLKGKGASSQVEMHCDK